MSSAPCRQQSHDALPLQLFHGGFLLNPGLILLLAAATFLLESQSTLSKFDWVYPGHGSGVAVCLRYAICLQCVPTLRACFQTFHLTINFKF